MKERDWMCLIIQKVLKVYILRRTFVKTLAISAKINVVSMINLL